MSEDSNKQQALRCGQSSVEAHRACRVKWPIRSAHFSLSSMPYGIRLRLPSFKMRARFTATAKHLITCSSKHLIVCHVHRRGPAHLLHVVTTSEASHVIKGSMPIPKQRWVGFFVMFVTVHALYVCMLFVSVAHEWYTASNPQVTQDQHQQGLRRETQSSGHCLDREQHCALPCNVCRYVRYLSSSSAWQHQWHVCLHSLLLLLLLTV